MFELKSITDEAVSKSVIIAEPESEPESVYTISQFASFVGFSVTASEKTVPVFTIFV